MRRTPVSRIVYAGTLRAGITRVEEIGEPDWRRQPDASLSIRCVQASSEEELVAAERFWMERYRLAGLGGFDQPTPGFESLSLPPVPHVPQHPVTEVVCWNSTTFLAYCQDPAEISACDVSVHGTNGHESLGNHSIAETNGAIVGREMTQRMIGERVCGTVTLLTPREFRSRSYQVSAVGRITHLAVEHAVPDGEQYGMMDRSIFFELTSCMHRAALQKGMTHLDAIVHPRHAKLYRRVFNAIPIGEPFACEQVGGSPGQYMRADITQPSHFHARLRARYESPLLGETG